MIPNFDSTKGVKPIMEELSMTLEKTAGYSKIRKSILYKIAREGKIPIVKIEFGKNGKVIIRMRSQKKIAVSINALKFYYGRSLIETL